jgi:ubiquinone/menaquinone biosynthesis C-methylase UbiE
MGDDDHCTSMVEDSPTSDASTDPKSIVRDGWNRVSTIYRPPGSRADAFDHTFADHKDWLEPFFRMLPQGTEVLDLGCGCGVPDAQLLSDRFRVTGVDISDVQIERARATVPHARFLRGDMCEVEFPVETFGGVACLYSLIHVPLGEQQGVLRKVFRWLAPGGLFLVTTGDEAWTGIEDRWLGSNARMYWSHADAPTYQGWLRETGFMVLRRTVVPDGESRHALFLARKPESPDGPTRGAPASLWVDEQLDRHAVVRDASESTI